MSAFTSLCYNCSHPEVEAQPLAEQPFQLDWVNYEQGFADGKAEAGQGAELSDVQIDLATAHIFHQGRPTSRAYRIGVVRAALEAADRAARGARP